MLTSRLAFPAAAFYLVLANLMAACVLAFLCVLRRLWRRYPAFTIYSVCISAKTAIMLWLKVSASNAAYIHAYYISSAVYSLLVGLCAAEIYLKVFGPRMALPARKFQNILMLMMAAALSAITLTSAMGSLKGQVLARILWTTEQGVLAIGCAVLVTMLIYSRQLRIPWLPPTAGVPIAWPPRAAGIAAGFVLMLSANMVAAIFIGRAPYPIALAAAFIGQSANLISFLWWVVSVYRKEAEPVPATADEVRMMAEWHEKSMLSQAK